MLLMFLGMSLAGSAAAYREHRRPAPGLASLLSGAVLLAGAWHLAPRWLGWAALGTIAAAWVWDQRLLRALHRAC